MPRVAISMTRSYRWVLDFFLHFQIFSSFWQLACTTYKQEKAHLKMATMTQQSTLLPFEGSTGWSLKGIKKLIVMRTWSPGLLKKWKKKKTGQTLGQGKQWVSRVSNRVSWHSHVKCLGKDQPLTCPDPVPKVCVFPVGSTNGPSRYCAGNMWDKKMASHSRNSTVWLQCGHNACQWNTRTPSAFSFIHSFQKKKKSTSCVHDEVHPGMLRKHRRF